MKTKDELRSCIDFQEMKLMELQKENEQLKTIKEGLYYYNEDLQRKNNQLKQEREELIEWLQKECSNMRSPIYGEIYFLNKIINKLEGNNG